MRHRTAATAAVALLAAACGSSQANGYTAVTVTEQTSTGYAELVMPDATGGQARDAIEGYAAGINPQAHELYYLKVTRSEDADGYVCRARWYRDVTSHRAHAGDPGIPDTWPHLAINCPSEG